MKIAGSLMNVSMTADNTDPKKVIYAYKQMSLQVTANQSPNEVATFDLTSIGEPYPFDFTKTYAFTIEPLAGPVGKGSASTFTCNSASASGGSRIWSDDDGEQPSVIEVGGAPSWTYTLTLMDVSNDNPKVALDNLSLSPLTGSLDLVPGPQFYNVTFGVE